MADTLEDGAPPAAREEGLIGPWREELVTLGARLRRRPALIAKLDHDLDDALAACGAAFGTPKRNLDALREVFTKPPGEILQWIADLAGERGLAKQHAHEIVVGEAQEFWRWMRRRRGRKPKWLGPLKLHDRHGPSRATDRALILWTILMIEERLRRRFRVSWDVIKRDTEMLLRVAETGLQYLFAQWPFTPEGMGESYDARAIMRVVRWRCSKAFAEAIDPALSAIVLPQRHSVEHMIIE